jgi:hypothetical protein
VRIARTLSRWWFYLVAVAVACGIMYGLGLGAYDAVANWREWWPVKLLVLVILISTIAHCILGRESPFWGLEGAKPTNPSGSGDRGI